jgi:hypothetical protein
MDTLKKKTGILIFFSVLFCVCSISNAQDYYGGGGNSWRKKPAANQPPQDTKEVEPSGYSSINFGFANPVGSFASSFGNGYGGYALSGIGYNLAIAAPISHSNFGIAFMFGSYTNEYDLNNYVNYLSNSNPYPNGVAYGSVSGGINNIYSESSILGGLYVTYPIGRLSIDGRFMVGALLNSLPEQAYGKIDSAGNQTVYDLQTSYPSSFAVDAGIGIRCLIAKLGRRQLCAMVNIDYLYSKVSYTTTQIVDYTPYANNPSGNYYETYNTISGHLPISLMNITFGLGYQFGGGE